MLRSSDQCVIVNQILVEVLLNSSDEELLPNPLELMLEKHLFEIVLREGLTVEVDAVGRDAIREVSAACLSFL